MEANAKRASLVNILKAITFREKKNERKKNKGMKTTDSDMEEDAVYRALQDRDKQNNAISKEQKKGKDQR